MDILGGLFGKVALAMAGKRSPWGKSSSGDDNTGGESGGERGESADGTPPRAEDKSDKPRGPKNPWLPGGGTSGSGDDRRRSANIEDIFRKRGPEGPRRAGGGGGGPRGPNFQMPRRADGKSWFPLAVMTIVGVWIMITSTHQVGPKEQGLVTWVGGQFSRTMQPGLNFTLPWPIQTVEVENVSEIRSEKIGSGGEKLILTGDQNLVDLSYLIRWNIKDLKQFRYQLSDPMETINEVAESAMRESVSEHELDRVLSGEGRADIEQSVRQRMQAILDAYKSGVAVQGIEIDKTDPPEQVIPAFNDVLAAQQNAEQEINQARRYAQQLLARAQGDATAFDKIYAEYRLAPEVTRRRLYYETMESVLGKTDKTVIESQGVTPYLPLPEVRRRAQQTATPPAAAETPAQGDQ